MTTAAIFVLGKHRSGTTWVTNLLAAHPKVFTPQHELHNGQHESAFFSSLLPYCNYGRTEVDRRAMAAIFERSDFWYLLFGDNPPVVDIEKYGVSGYFAKVMEIAARRRKCTHWVEKTPGHTLCLDDLFIAYPDAKFVAVKRSHLDVVNSNVHKFRNPNNVLDWLAEAISCELYSKVISVHRNRIHVVNYESLLNDCYGECRDLFNYVGVAIPDTVGSGWAANSSFDGARPSIPLKGYWCLRIVQLAFAIAPGKAWASAVRFHRRFKRGKLPSWFFLVFQGASQ